VQVRFLLGPAGSGKSFRCLAEIRAALAAGSDRLAAGQGEDGKLTGGTPGPLESLVLLAPKQATFQLERQLLADDTLAGYTRLHVLSFDRLAEFVFARLNVASPRLLSGEGRLMVLRALLRQHDGELKLLRGSARRSGFAQELGGQLAELQQQQFGPARLRALAADQTLRRELRDKLHDLALLAEKYADWLKQHELQDANCLLEIATGRLRAETPRLEEENIQHSTFNVQRSKEKAERATGKPPKPAPELAGWKAGPAPATVIRHSSFVIQHLWLDGFAEMTPQEHALLAAIIPFCRQATLAFCLETEPTPAASWLSIWSAIGKTFQRCREQLAALPGCQVQTEILRRLPGRRRFPENSALDMLEAGWALPVAAPEIENPDLASQISITACPTPEAEAVFAARELLKFVRQDRRHRFRDCAVLVRNLETYHQPLARIFRRYEIPFFLDRRENVAHHPLAELTRSALRTVANDWRHDDWFAALKAGFTPLPEPDLDRLENLALEFGWRGKQWREPLPEPYGEGLRQQMFRPFGKFHARLRRQKFEPTGGQLAEAIRELWDDLQVEATLEEWSQPMRGEPTPGARAARPRVSMRDDPASGAGTPGERTGSAATSHQTDFEPIIFHQAGSETGAPASHLPGFEPMDSRHPTPHTPHPSTQLHQTVYEQMVSWADNVALAFPREPLPLRDWLPVLDAGLAGLTVGVIPPALDEVLVGAIDRARNPDLKFALLLGVNESVFPAAPAAPVILTNADRDELDRQNAALGANVFDQISRERYLGYIACTRASHKLAVTFARQDASGRTLNPSPIIALIKKHFPQLEIAEFSGVVDWREAEQVGELIPEIVRLNQRSAGVPLAGSPNVSLGDGTGGEMPPEPAAGDGCATIALFEAPAIKSLAGKLAQLREPEETENLSPALASKIYGAVLKSSVSRLEEFAQCPFRFFIHSGLRAGERKKFELDARERGSFQHEILKRFHGELTAEGKRWRDLTPAEARERISRIGADLAPDYREGLLRADDQSRFTARVLTAALQDFVATLVAWMRGQYEFDPAKAETGFGLDDPGLPAWEIDLNQGHKLALCGRVDRIDLCQVGDQSLAVVMDYKSSVRKLDKILVAHGVQLQLLAYLAAVRRWPAAFFGAKAIVPAGVFYVNLRGQFESGASRAEVLTDPDEARRLAYRHSGRFDAAFLDHLDRLRVRDQFNYQLNQDGRVRSNSAEALSCKEFIGLLDQVEEQLRTLGEKIYDGATAVDPYRKGVTTPCGYCDYRAVCRIDEWTHEFRELRAVETT